jgi:Protein of unknown function (DUF1566)
MPNVAADVTSGAPTSTSYTDNGDGTVTDNVTALVWQQTVSTAFFPWGNSSTVGTAQNYCANLQLAGHTDWRLPSQIELLSIVDQGLPEGTGAPLINTTLFPTPLFGSTYFWSSTPAAGSPGSGWGVAFNSGNPLNGMSPGLSCQVRCVR